MGSKLLYYLVIYPISRLPFPILYRLSNLTYYLMYYVVKYRKKVVFDNIQKAFPEKSVKEVEKSSKVFFRHLCDLIFESVKNFTISEKELINRVKFIGLETAKPFADKGQNIIGTAGHFGSWETIAVHIGSIPEHKHYGIVKRLKNKFFNDKIFASRTKYKTGIVPMKETKDFFLINHPKPVSLTFIGDQWPSNPQKCHWTSFLGRETPFFYGAEKYALAYNWPVFYLDIFREKRGHYTIELTCICEDPSKLTYKGELIDLYVKKLEETIYRNPDYYLWSHKRWKKSKAEVQKTIQ